MEWYFWIILVAVFIFAFPIFLQVRFYFDGLKNSGVMSIQLFGFILITSCKFKLDLNSINISKLKKEKEIKLNFSNLQFAFYFFKAFLGRVKIFKTYLFTVVGDKKNAFNTAIYSGVVQTGVLTVISFLNNYKNTNTKYLCEQTFEENNLNVSGYVSIFFMPALLVECFFLSAWKIFRRVKNGK